MNNEDKKYLADVLKEHEDRLYKMIKEQYLDGLEADSDYYDNFIKDVRTRLEKLEELHNNMSDSNVNKSPMAYLNGRPISTLGEALSIALFEDDKKERKLLIAPDFVRYNVDDYTPRIYVLNNENQPVFTRIYAVDDDRIDYTLYDSRNPIGLSFYKPCGFKRMKFSELKEGDIFVEYIKIEYELSDFKYNILYGDDYGCFYDEYAYHYGNVLNEQVYKIVPLDEADVYEDEVDSE